MGNDLRTILGWFNGYTVPEAVTVFFLAIGVTFFLVFFLGTPSSADPGGRGDVTFTLTWTHAGPNEGPDIDFWVIDPLFRMLIPHGRTVPTSSPSDQLPNGERSITMTRERQEPGTAGARNEPFCPKAPLRKGPTPMVFGIMWVSEPPIIP